MSNPVAGAARAMLAGITAVLLLASMWVLETADSLADGRLDREFGLPGPDTPGHDPEGLWRLFTWSFFHGDYGHLMANSAPLLALGFLTALRGFGRFIGVTLIIMVVSGLGVWFLADPSSRTIGASGLVFGYFGYLLARGFVERKASDIVVAVLVLVVYGTMIFGVFPNQPGISWQAHMFGLIGGVMAAAVLRQRRRLSIATQAG